MFVGATPCLRQMISPEQIQRCHFPVDVLRTRGSAGTAEWWLAWSNNHPWLASTSCLPHWFCGFLLRYCIQYWSFVLLIADQPWPVNNWINSHLFLFIPSILSTNTELPCPKSSRAVVYVHAHARKHMYVFRLMHSKCVRIHIYVNMFMYIHLHLHMPIHVHTSLRGVIFILWAWSMYTYVSAK